MSNIKADKNIKGHVGSPMGGLISEIRCKEGEHVEKGQPLVVLSAMKMVRLFFNYTNQFGHSNVHSPFLILSSSFTFS